MIKRREGLSEPLLYDFFIAIRTESPLRSPIASSSSVRARLYVAGGKGGRGALGVLEGAGGGPGEVLGELATGLDVGESVEDVEEVDVETVEDKGEGGGGGRTVVAAVVVVAVVVTVETVGKIMAGMIEGEGEVEEEVEQEDEAEGVELD